MKACQGEMVDDNWVYRICFVCHFTPSDLWLETLKFYLLECSYARLAAPST